MQRANWLTCFWPGLSRLWIKGGDHPSGCGNLFRAYTQATGYLGIVLTGKFVEMPVDNAVFKAVGFVQFSELDQEALA